MPKVSVIIPTYNHANYICETIDSVLAQTYKDYKIIVVNDGSTDNTREVLANYSEKIKYLYQENKGTPAARNFGISKSKGEYIAFLDDDDLWLPDKLEKQVDVLDKNPDLGFVSSSTYKINSEGRVLETWNKGIYNYETFESLYEANFVTVLTVVLRRKCLNDVGIFDEELLGSSDYDLWLRIAKKYRFQYIKIPLAKYRVHDTNMGRNLELMYHDWNKIFNKQEVAKNQNMIRKNIARAKHNYDFARHYYNTRNFSKAGLCYLKSILDFPFIGFYYWPKEAENFRFSLPYRILKIYFLFVKCIFKTTIHNLKTKIELCQKSA